MITIVRAPALRAAVLCALALSAACALPPRKTDELPPRVGTVDEHAAEAAERNRQERENRELLAYRAEQKRREEAEAEARRKAEAEQVRVTRLADLQRQKEAEEASARAEAARREQAAAEAKQKVALARRSAAGQKAPADPAARLAQRRADPRWTRPGFSGLLCAARADRERAAARLAAEKKKGKRADAARLADAERRVGAAEARSQKARGELQKLGLAPLGCKDPRTSEVAACFRAADAGKACKKGMSYVEVVRSFGG